MSLTPTTLLGIIGATSVLLGAPLVSSCQEPLRKESIAAGSSTLKPMTPQERVEAYIRAWHQCWLDQNGGKPYSPAEQAKILGDLFDKWASAVAGISKVHWAAKAKDDSASGFGYPPTHDPAIEKVRRATISGDTAVVETARSNGSFPEFTEYRLVRKAGEWRITKATDFYDDENEAAFEPDQLAALLRLPTTGAKLPAAEAGDDPNCDVLFTPGHIVKGNSSAAGEAVKVRNVGKLSLPSGTIVVQDFGYSPEDARPLSLRVPSGDYDVEVCFLRGRNGAVRILFDPANPGPFQYRRAVTTEKEHSYVGVDAGNVALADAQAFMNRTKRQHTRDYEAWVETTLARKPTDDDVTFLQLGNATHSNAVVVGSGYGDGSYPAFWMLDTKGKLVALVVDFQIAAEYLTRSIKMPWKPGFEGTVHDEPGARGLQVRVDRSDNVGVAVKGGQVKTIQWFNKSGKIVATNAEVGSWASGEESGWSVDLARLDGKAAEMEVILYTGFRNAR